MADLLTDSQRADIRAALKDVTDTFMKTPVVYHKAVDSLDRFNEDRGDMKLVDYNLSGLLEYMTNDKDEVDEAMEGSLNTQRVQVTFNLEDVAAVGLIADDIPTMQPESDFFTANGERYRVTYVGTDGPLTKRAILVVIKGKLQPKES